MSVFPAVIWLALAYLALWLMRRPERVATPAGYRHLTEADVRTGRAILPIPRLADPMFSSFAIVSE